MASSNDVGRLLASITKVELAYDGSDNLEYVGLAEPGTATSAALWQIRKLIYSSGNLAQVLWEGGNLGYDSVWDDRASLSFS